MRRLAPVLVVLVFASPAARAATFKPFAFNGVVIAAPMSGARYVAASDGQVYSVFVPRPLPAGTKVAVHGTRLESDRYSVWATPPDGSIRATGRTSEVVVRAELGWVDESQGRFQLGAHGQVVGWVQYPKRLQLVLKEASRAPGTGTMRFRLHLSSGHLSLFALVR